MRAWQLQNTFGLENLKPIDFPKRSPEADEVLIQIQACSLNYRDLMVIKGLYNPKLRFPLIPLSDGAGIIEAVGKDVTNLKVGDKVCAIFSQTWDYGMDQTKMHKGTLGEPLDGMLSTHITLKAHGVIKVPDYLTVEEAATLPCAAVTAFNAIFCQSSFNTGDTLLIEGTGGVALFALQFAHALNLKSIVTSSCDDKLSKAKKLGATHTINYQKTPNWQSEVLKLTDGCGVDGVIEVGGANTLNKALGCTKSGGVISVIGILSGISCELNLIPMLMKNIRLQGVFVGSRQVFESMNRVLQHTHIHPVIDKIFAFEDAHEAFSYMESQKHFGKVVIKI